MREHFSSQIRTVTLYPRCLNTSLHHQYFQIIEIIFSIGIPTRPTIVSALRIEFRCGSYYTFALNA